MSELKRLFLPFEDLRQIEKIIQEKTNSSGCGATGRRFTGNGFLRLKQQYKHFHSVGDPSTNFRCDRRTQLRSQ